MDMDMLKREQLSALIDTSVKIKEAESSSLFIVSNIDEKDAIQSLFGGDIKELSDMLFLIFIGVDKLLDELPDPLREGLKEHYPERLAALGLISMNMAQKISDML